MSNNKNMVSGQEHVEPYRRIVSTPIKLVSSALSLLLRGNASEWIQKEAIAPYYQDMVASITLVETNMLPSVAGADMYGRVYYNPELIEHFNLSVHEMAAVILHEFEHIRRQHHKRAIALVGERANKAIQDLLNICMDLEINNSDLFGKVWPNLPDWTVTPEKMGLEKGHLFEWYFKKFQMECPFCGHSGGGQSDGSGNSDNNSGESGDNSNKQSDNKSSAQDNNAGKRSGSGDGQDNDGTSGSSESGSESSSNQHGHQSAGSSQNGHEGNRADNSCDHGSDSGSCNSEDGTQDGSAGQGNAGSQSGTGQQSSGSGQSGKGSQQNHASCGAGSGQEGSQSGQNESNGSAGGHGSGSDASGAGHNGHEPDCPFSQYKTCSGGSATTGQHAPWELGEPDPNNEMDGGLSQGEVDNMLRRVAERMKRRERSYGIGSVPAELARWADEFLKSKTDYKKALRSFIQRDGKIARGKAFITYRRLPRRYRNDIITPARMIRKLNVAVVADTSGSMGDDEISAIFAEVAQVCMDLRANFVDVFSCDADVHGPPARIKSKRDVRAMKLYGGGGTDMGVGLAAVEQHQHHVKGGYALTIVMTDALTPWPESRPNLNRIIVVSINQGDDPRGIPDWVDAVIHVNINDYMKQAA